MQWLTEQYVVGVILSTDNESANFLHLHKGRSRVKHMKSNRTHDSLLGGQ